MTMHTPPLATALGYHLLFSRHSLMDDQGKDRLRRV